MYYVVSSDRLCIQSDWDTERVVAAATLTGFVVVLVRSATAIKVGSSVAGRPGGLGQVVVVVVRRPVLD